MLLAKPKKIPADVRTFCIDLTYSILQSWNKSKLSPSQKFVLREILDALVWKYTEAGGKYFGANFWSEQAINQGGRNWKLKLHHSTGLELDHAIERREVIDRILKAKTLSEVRREMGRCITCAVLSAEHKDLNRARNSSPRIKWRKLYRDLKIIPREFDVVVVMRRKLVRRRKKKANA